MPRKVKNRETPANRRHKKDWILQALPFFSVIGWFLALMSLAFLDRGQGLSGSSCLSIFDPDAAANWDRSSIWATLIILLITFGFSVVGFILNTRRHKRKTDRYNKSILIVGGITLAAIIILLVTFGPYLF